jgi:pyrophosphate--fructose-6-phosphate 1-phosphotransferase
MKLGLSKKDLDVNGIYILEVEFNIEAEAKQLHQGIDTCDCVNLFVSEGASIESIVKEMEK